MHEADLSTLAFLVLMQATRTAQDDLEAIMASTKAINSTKAQQRHLLPNNQTASGAMAAQTPCNPGLPCSAASHRSESEQPVQSRVQAATDRQAKLMAALSNLMKKGSDTGASVSQNLKQALHRSPRRGRSARTPSP